VAQKNKGPGIQSAAGLIRYYDTEEDTNIKIPPVFILILSAVVALVALIIRATYII
jgi:preprotein translocase subunit Sec61beta